MRKPLLLLSTRVARSSNPLLHLVTTPEEHTIEPPFALSQTAASLKTLERLP
jgi:hypothetical protein